MHNSAEVTRLETRRAAPAPRQLVACITGIVDGRIRLDDAGSVLVARRAAGCLLRPEPGDRVLAVVEGPEAWVLNVLERDPARTGVIDVEGPLALHSGSGDLDLDAPGAVRLRAGRAIELDSARLGVRAAVAELVTRRLSWLGEQFEGRFDRLRLVGRIFEGLLKRLHLRAGSACRDIDGLDRTRAGRIASRAAGDMTLQAGNLVGRAEGLARLDGKQIHLG